VTLVSQSTEITAGSHAGGKAVYLRDPDGFTVELYQGPPAAPVESHTAAAAPRRATAHGRSA
jgi:catechol-2,3-dioxygenase